MLVDMLVDMPYATACPLITLRPEPVFCLRCQQRTDPVVVKAGRALSKGGKKKHKEKKDRRCCFTSVLAGLTTPGMQQNGKKRNGTKKRKERGNSRSHVAHPTTYPLSLTITLTFLFFHCFCLCGYRVRTQHTHLPAMYSVSTDPTTISRHDQPMRNTLLADRHHAQSRRLGIFQKGGVGGGRTR